MQFIRGMLTVVVLSIVFASQANASIIRTLTETEEITEVISNQNIIRRSQTYADTGRKTYEMSTHKDVFKTGSAYVRLFRDNLKIQRFHEYEYDIKSLSVAFTTIGYYDSWLEVRDPTVGIFNEPEIDGWGLSKYQFKLKGNSSTFDNVLYHRKEESNLVCRSETHCKHYKRGRTSQQTATVNFSPEQIESFKRVFNYSDGFNYVKYESYKVPVRLEFGARATITACWDAEDTCQVRSEIRAETFADITIKYTRYKWEYIEVEEPKPKPDPEPEPEPSEPNIVDVSAPASSFLMLPLAFLLFATRKRHRKL